MGAVLKFDNYRESSVLKVKKLGICLLVLSVGSGCSNASGVEGAAIKGIDWMAGYWLACAQDAQTAEAWIGAGSGLLVGVNHGMGAHGPTFEHMRIGSHENGQLAYFASPGGAPTVVFALKSRGEQSVTFENLAHDYPHRVIYSRKGEELIGRIEGVVDGENQSMEWQYRLAPLGENCAP